MYIYGKQRVLLLIYLWTSGQIYLVDAQTTTQSPLGKKCGSSDECSDKTPACCGKTGFRHCRTSTNCIGVPCASSFDCDDGRMWCCGHKCEDSACLLPVWAIVLIALAVSILVSVLLIYIILECCRRWPNVRRTCC